MRHCPTVLLLAIMFAACGGRDAEREAEAKAAVEAIRAEYDTREARIEAAIKQAHESRAKADLPAVQWGDLPAPKFLDVRNDKFNKEANGHIFELAADGKLNTDPATLLGLFVDTSWRDDIAEKVKGEGHLTKGGVEAAFEKFKQVRFLCLLVAESHAAATLGTGTLFTVNFKTGHWKGRAFYFDLEADKLLGVRAIEVQNSSNVKFETEGFSEDEQRKRADGALTEDLRKQVLAAAATPQG